MVAAPEPRRPTAQDAPAVQDLLEATADCTLRISGHPPTADDDAARSPQRRATRASSPAFTEGHSWASTE
ncbi:hypothetical protein EAE32_00850 [Kocuria tytonicola]|uniref:Uncharacterized protein n=1 Tax=Kocuria tytonicola TaxID=2055946 RepID=A0A3L9L4X0_9MICC|nr:hypothetical protein EAE32_00850 [Kocuria tytonicola]